MKKKKPENKFKSFHISLEPAILGEFQIYLDNSGQNRSEVIRNLVKKLLKSKEAKQLLQNDRFI